MSAPTHLGQKPGAWRTWGANPGPSVCEAGVLTAALWGRFSLKVFYQFILAKLTAYVREQDVKCPCFSF